MPLARCLLSLLAGALASLRPVAGAQQQLNSPVIEARAQCTQAGALAKDCRLRLLLQPYANAVFALNGKELKARFSKHEKTLALAELYLAGRHISEERIFLTLTDKKSRGSRQIAVILTTEPVIDTPLVFIDNPNARHRFVRRIATGKQPKSAMFISDRQVILPLLDDNHIEVIDIVTNEIRRIELPAHYAKSGGFVESVNVPSRGEFWVSQMKAAAIHRFAANTLEYRGTIPLSGAWTKVLAYDSVRNLVYASNWNSADISVVSVQDLKELKKIKLGSVPRGMAISADGNMMVAAMFGGKSDIDRAGRTVLIDLNSQKIMHTIISGGAHRHAVRLRTGKDVFAVSDMARSFVYFIENYTKVGETKVFANPNTIVESADGRYLYVSCRGHNNPKSFLLKGPDFGRLMVIDIATRKVVEEIEAGNQPTGLDVSPDGKYVVLTDFLDHAMRVYERLP
jgi:DNA-binding beta-propeller fold protein YncE